MDNKENPLYKYPHEKLPMQKQKAPGLQEEMRPVPDCGEDSYRGSGKLKGKKALITGGDSGIGRAVAIAFAREGAQVAITFLPEEQEDVNSLVRLLEKESVSIRAFACNLRKEESCQTVIQQVVNEWETIDILVINAAVQQANEDITTLTAAQILETFEVNVFSGMYLSKAAVSHLKAGSSIIFTGSAEYYTPNKTLLDYAASKCAIVGFSIGLSKQLIDKGIRVNTICPGPVWTPLEISGGNPDEGIPGHGLDTPMKRPAQPVEMSSLYVYLASADASYATGEIYGLTGGLSSL